MEPLDTDLEYVARGETNPRARFNWLYIIPVLGLVWLLYLIGAAVVQWPVSGAVDPVMSFMLVLFFVMAGLLFWAMAPRAHH